MAIPTAITLNDIVIEALKKAGYGDPSSQQSSLIARAEDQWAREIKNDIFTASKKLTSLMTSAIVPLTLGRSRYDLPTDFSSLLSMNLLSGTTTGTARAGTTSSITLASTDTSSSDIIGKEIVIMSGTGSSQISQIYAFNTTSKVANFYPSITAPSSDSVYLVIDKYDEIREHPIWDYDKMAFPFRQEKPLNYFPIGDSDNGEFILAQAPDSANYAIRIRYYADLTRLDLTGTLLSTLYRRWQNVWYTGLLAKALAHIDDDGATEAEGKYNQKVQELTMREGYGLDLNNLRFRIQED